MHDNLKGPPSRGGRIQSRMAPGMFQACLNLEYAVASHRRPPWEPAYAPYTPALQRRNTLWVTSKAAYEGRATEQCGLTPTPSACTALSLKQAHLSNPCQQVGNQSVNHALLLLQGGNP